MAVTALRWWCLRWCPPPPPCNDVEAGDEASTSDGTVAASFASSAIASVGGIDMPMRRRDGGFGASASVARPGIDFECDPVLVLGRCSGADPVVEERLLDDPVPRALSGGPPVLPTIVASAITLSAAIEPGSLVLRNTGSSPDWMSLLVIRCMETPSATSTHGFAPFRRRFQLSTSELEAADDVRSGRVRDAGWVDIIPSESRSALG